MVDTRKSNGTPIAEKKKSSSALGKLCTGKAIALGEDWLTGDFYQDISNLFLRASTLRITEKICPAWGLDDLWGLSKPWDSLMLRAVFLKIKHYWYGSSLVRGCRCSTRLSRRVCLRQNWLWQIDVTIPSLWACLAPTWSACAWAQMGLAEAKHFF